MSKPPFNPRALGRGYGGPVIGMEDGEYVLYSWSNAPSGETYHVRHQDWDEFCRLVDEYIDPPAREFTVVVRRDICIPVNVTPSMRKKYNIYNDDIAVAKLICSDTTLRESDVIKLVRKAE